MRQWIRSWIYFIPMNSIVIIIFPNVKITRAKLPSGSFLISKMRLIVVYYWSDGSGYDYIAITVNVMHMVQMSRITYKINFIMSYISSNGSSLSIKPVAI